MIDHVKLFMYIILYFDACIILYDIVFIPNQNITLSCITELHVSYIETYDYDIHDCILLKESKPHLSKTFMEVSNAGFVHPMFIKSSLPFRDLMLSVNLEVISCNGSTLTQQRPPLTSP